jgi:CRISPR-associated protein Cas2
MRRRYLVWYDIRDPKRLRATHKVLVGHGDPLQYSVFLCDLSGVERTRLVSRLKKVINEASDSVAIFDLGPTGPSGPARRIETIGPSKPMPVSGEPTII